MENENNNSWNMKNGLYTKEQVVEAIREFIPTFEHEEKGKNLDQKM